MGTSKIKAVHSDEFESFLKNLGILEDVKNGKYNCEVCRAKVDLSNIACVYPENKEVKFCCNNTSCYEKIIDRHKEK